MKKTTKQNILKTLKVIKNITCVLLIISILAIGTTLSIDAILPLLAKEKHKENFLPANGCYIEKELKEEKKTCEEIVAESLSCIPKEMREIIEEGWTIVFVSSQPEYLHYPDYYTEYDVLSATMYKERTILVKPMIDKGKGVDVLVHEFGHAASWEYGYAEKGREFLLLFDAYKEEYVDIVFPTTGYAVSGEDEFFACMFRNYFKDPEYIKEHAPLVYEYMDNILKEGPHDNVFEFVGARMAAYGRSIGDAYQR